jgi:hypothetical protein
MAAPVWVLSVDLQAKTATFQTGMAEAARAARGAFTDVGNSAQAGSERAAGGLLNVRASLGILDNSIRGNHAAAMADLIRLFAQSEVVMAALPFAATAGGILLLGGVIVGVVNKMREWREEQAKLTDSETVFGTAVQNAFNALDMKMLEAEKRADELRNDHLGALNVELKEIDRQSMDELVHSFEEVGKAADVVLGELKTSWYQMGIGSAGASHALAEFSIQYRSLLAQGKLEQANSLLAGTKADAESVLFMQKQAAANELGNSGSGKQADYQKYLQAVNVLKAAGVGYSEKETKAQQVLVDALNDQVTMEQKVAALKGLDKGNATRAEQNGAAKDGESRAKALAEAEQKGVDEEGRIIREANEKMATDIAEGWRQQIEDTDEGSKARLAITNAAMADELAQGMDSTASYRDLMNARVQLVRQMAEEEAKTQAEAARESADNDERMGELRVAAEKQAMATADSGRRVSESQRLAEAARIADEEYELKYNALEKEIAALNKSGNDYLNQLKALQDKEKQLYQQHEDELSSIREKAEIATNDKLSASYQHFTATISGELSKSIMGHQTWAKMVESLGDQAISSMIQNGIQYALSNKFRQESDARAAASAGFKFGMEYGGPAAPVLAPIMAAVAFAGALAFEGGTDRVPGVTRGDTVRAMLTPGEGIVPGGVMDGLRTMARNGGFNGGGSQIHVHGVHYAPTVHALDATGVDTVLEKHADTFQKHFEGVLRRMNR